jgi:charged multivesicular body protein 4
VRKWPLAWPSDGWAHRGNRIDDETAKAKANATTNKRGGSCKPLAHSGSLTDDRTVALNALRQKKNYETQLDQLAGRRLTLETQVCRLQRVRHAIDIAQVNALEAANMNMETMRAMKEGAVHLKRIHGNLCAGSSTSLP